MANEDTDKSQQAAIDSQILVVSDTAAQTGNPRMMRAVEGLVEKLREAGVTTFCTPPDTQS